METKYNVIDNTPPPPNPSSVFCEDKIHYMNDYLYGTCILDVCTVF